MLYLGIETHFWLDSQTVQTTHPSYCPPSTAPFTITITISCSRPLHLVHLGLPVLHSGRPQTILCTLSFSLGLPSDSSLTLSPSRGEVSCLPLPFDGPGQVCLTYTLSPPSHSIIFTPLTKSIRLQLYNVLHIPQLHVNIAEKVTHCWAKYGHPGQHSNNPHRGHHGPSRPSQPHGSAGQHRLASWKWSKLGYE